MRKLTFIIKKFIKDNRKYIISASILLIGQAFLYWFLKLFQRNPIYINYYLDNKIPFIGKFVYLYDSFYPFMVISLYFLYKNDEKSYYKAIISGIIGFIICDIIFLSIPTIMYRPVIPKSDLLTDFIIRITYYFDNPPLNCFPSIHCLFCFQVIYTTIISRNIAIDKKIIITIISLLIALSTVLVKQHYFYDILGAFIVFVLSNILVYIIKKIVIER